GADGGDQAMVAAPKVAASASYSAGLMADGDVWVWGSGIQSPRRAVTSDGAKFVDILACDSALLALSTAGEVYIASISSTGLYSLVKRVSLSATGNKKVVQMAGTNDHYLLLTENGMVYGWGSNQYGKLGVGKGSGTSSDSYTYDQLQKVDGLVGGTSNRPQLHSVVSIAAGVNSSAALLTNGQVYTWGNNAQGQLATGTDNSAGSLWNNKDVPTLARVDVSAAGDAGLKGLTYDKYLRGAQSVSVGDSFVAALADTNANTAATGDRTVYTWGGNSYGQLGHAAAGNKSLYPQAVVSTGWTNSGAAENPAKAVAWKNVLMVSTEADESYMTGKVLGTTANYGAAATTGTWSYTGTDGAAKTAAFAQPEKFSDNANGEHRGVTDVKYYHSDPYSNKLDHVVGLAFGTNHGLALRRDGTIYAWGSNASGQLGGYYNNVLADDATDDKVESQISNGNPNYRPYAFRVGADDYHSLFVNNSLAIAETSGSYKLVNGAGETDKLVQVQPEEGDGSLNGVSQQAFVTIHENQKLTVDLSKVTMKYTSGFHLWNDYTTTDMKQAVADESGSETGRTLWENIDTTGVYTVAVSDPNVATAKVENGQIVITPVKGGVYGRVSVLIKRVETEAAGTRTASNGTADYGIIELTVIQDTSATPALAGNTATTRVAAPQVAAGAGFVASLRADGTVWTWGYNASGELGDGSTTNRSTPVQVVTDVYGTTLKNIIAIATGDSFTIALDKYGYVWAWGDNAYHQLGQGDSNTTDYHYARRVLKGAQPVTEGAGTEAGYYLSDIKAIAAGNEFAGAVDTNGFVYTWGRNNKGQLGNGNITTSTVSYDRGLPVRVLAGSTAAGTTQTTWAYDNYLRNVIAISAGGAYMTAMLDNSSVVAWGDSENKQLGLEYSSSPTVPYAVLRGNSLTGVEREPSRANESRYLHQVVGMAGGDIVTLYQSANTVTDTATAGKHYLLYSGKLTTDRSGNVQEGVERIAHLTKGDLTTYTSGSAQYEAAKGDTTLADDIYDMAAGDRNVVLVRGAVADSQVLTKGLNRDGQLGQSYVTGQIDAVNTGVDTATNFVVVRAPQAQQPVGSRDLVTFTGTTASVAINDYTTVMYQADGTIYTVGRGTSGQLGDGTTASKSLPVQVGQGNAITAKAAYATLSGSGATTVYNGAAGTLMPDYLAMNVEDTLTIDISQVKFQYSQGFNLYKDAYLQDRNSAVSDVYITVSDATIGKLAGVGADGKAGATVTLTSADKTKTGATDLIITIRDKAGNVMAVGTTRVTFYIRSVVAQTMVSAGNRHSVALAEDGTLWVWGANENGQLGLANTGDNKTSYKEYPYQLTVTDETGSTVRFVRVAAGSTYTLAVDTSGNLWGWGWGSASAAGTLPTRVDGYIDVAEVAVYGNRGIVLTKGGAVKTWTGRTGAGTAATEENVDVTGLGAIKQVAVGAEHFMLLGNYTEANG
ncbi:MAG: hypothetical protein NC311_16840, partial [Muribaculaceae bacterium]|nr:hypothetical protein [Muribaculaceae bacterium]